MQFQHGKWQHSMWLTLNDFDSGYARVLVNFVKFLWLTLNESGNDEDYHFVRLQMAKKEEKKPINI